MKKSSLLGILLLFICITGLFSQEKNYSEQLITVKNGGVVQLGDVKVEIPAGALKEDTVISITRLDQVEDTGDTISNATMSAGGYRFLPAGTKFRKNVTISIPYEPSLNAKPLVLNDTYTYFYDVEKKGWVQLERKSIDNQNCIIQSYTNHFTDMINATLTMPETASPVDFNLNSIKGLEASKADAQVLNFNPPQGSNYGDAGFSITLDILQGRNGMQPQVSLAYSSSIGNGVLGKGFDLNFGSAITIDTRKKLPEYNENDIYMLDGIQLRLINKYNDYYEYELKRKTGYQIIRRYNPYSNESDKIDYWEVISSNGVISRYGLEEDSTVGKDDKIFTWYLTKIIDQNQNFVEYKYFNDSGYIYIDDIVYTGHAEEPGSYHVKFEYEGRLDIRIDARSGQAVSCKKRVKTIKSYYQSEASLFREYVFNYKEGLSKSSLLEKFTVYSSYNKDSSDEKDSYEYSFDYYDLDGEPFFGSPVKFSSETQLDKSSSFSSGVSVYGSGGGGVGSSKVDVRVTGGGSISDSSSDSHTDSTIIDINGDGFVDKISKSGRSNNLYVSRGDGNTFGSEQSITINWKDNIPKGFILNDQTSDSSSKSGIVYGGLYGNLPTAGLSLGYTFTATDSDSSTSTTTSFMDVDGDGLVDIVLNTTSYLRNESTESDIIFTEYNINGFPSYTFEPLTLEDKQNKSKDYLMNRPFRIWKAPYSGQIQIDNKVSKTNNPDIKGNVYYKVEDKQITDSINNNTSKTVLTNINNGQDVYFVPDVGNDIPETGKEDKTKSLDWDISIKYLSVKPFSYEGKTIFLVPPLSKKIKEVEFDTDSHGYPSTFKSYKFEESNIPQGIKNLYINPVNKTQDTVHLQPSWATIIKNLDPNSIKYLIDSYSFLPYVLTEEQMLKLNDDNKKLLADFYYYDYPSGNFYLDENQLINKITESYNSVNVSIFKKINSDIIYNYSLTGIPLKFTIQNGNIDYVYETFQTVKTEGSDRFQNEKGTFNNFGETFNIQTQIADDYIYSVFKNSQGEYELNSKNNNYLLKTFNVLDDSVEVILNDTHNRYDIKLIFDSKKSSPIIITQQEMDALFDKYREPVSFEQLKAEFENKELHLDGEEITENDILDFFKDAIEKDFLSERDVLVLLQEEISEDELNILLFKYSNYKTYSEHFSDFVVEDEYWKCENDNSDVIQDLCLYYFEDYTISINYNKNASYDITNNMFSILDFDTEGNIAYKDISLPLLYTNSETDFNSENSVSDKQKELEEFTFANCFYGGYKGWYYAIWTGTESENPFNIKAVESFLKGNADLNALDIKTEEDMLKARGDDGKTTGLVKEKMQATENQENFTILIPSDNVSKTIVEKETLTTITNEILVGPLTRNVYKTTDEEENIIFYDENFISFIKGNVIHCSRSGGDTYYKIEGMPGNTSINVITTTKTTGTEHDHCGTAGVDFDENVAKGMELDGSVSVTISDNTSNMNQAFFDITGDRIPDLLLIKNSLYVYEGYIKNNELCFKQPYRLTDVKTISKSKNYSIGIGGSFNGKNVTNIEYSKSGKVKAVLFDGAGGCNGTDTQLCGFIDINGDGIEDFVNEGNVKLGTGKSLTDDDSFIYKGPLSKSEFSTSNIGAKPFSFGDGATDFLNEEEAKKIQDFQKKQQHKDYREAISSADSNSVSFNIDGGVGGNSSSNTTTTFMADVNGDGLLDLVEDKGGYINVKYNLGNTFDSKITIISLPSWTSCAELCTTIDNSNDTQTSEQQAQEDYSEYLQSTNNSSGSLSLGIHANATIQFKVWLVTCKIIASYGNNLNFSWGDSHSETKFMDIDGDGLPDAVIATDKGIFYKKNLSGQADLIKSVKIPQGGVCKIEYGYVAPSFNMPMAKNVMSKVTLTDGSLDEKGQRLDEKGKINENLMPYVDNGDHETVVTYKYENGKYDRAEREYYGFGKLTATSENGNYTVSTFKVDPDEYWLKGCLKESQQYTASDFLLFENTLTYPGEKDAPQSNLPAVDEVSLPVKEETKYYEEPDKNNYVSSKTEYVYDEFLNVTELKTTYNDDETKIIRAKVGYTNDFENNHYSLPVSIEVYGTNESGQEELLRKRIGEYSPTGNLIKLEQYYEEDKALTTNLDYDEDGYGNIVRVTEVRVTDPTGVSVEYVYDDLHQFVKTIKQVSSTDNSDFLVTSVEIDPKYQVKRKETDLNGNEMNYEYDNWQRLTEVYSPYDTLGNPADACVKFEYHTSKNSFWYVITTNKVAFEDVPQGQPNYIKTIVIQDGLSRVVQTAKTGYVCENPEADENSLSFKKGWNVSGSVKYDEYGRVIEQGQTYFVEGESVDTIIKEKYTNNEYVIKAINVTETEYDNRDRVISTKLPDTVTMSTEYSIQGKYLKTVSIDPNHNRTVQFTDAQGKIFKVEKWDANNVLLTSITYEYNMMGEMLKACERGKEDINNPAPENPVTVEYDMLGRTTALEYVDSGRKQYYYGDSTLLLWEDDSRLRNENRKISYKYDGFNRLVTIDYMDKEDTVITYGTQKDTNINAYGRVVSVQDEGTSVSYKYGKLGQVVEETRTITNFIDSNPVKEQKSATMKYQSDYLGRMQKIIYPDGEVVVYSYDYGGQVNKVTGNKPGLSEIDYVKNIGYDEQGQRNFIIFGNGVKTTYTYDKQRGWLKNIYTVSYNNNNQLLQNIYYDFDDVGNVNFYINDCKDGGNYYTKQEYKYDSLYQLTSVHGDTSFYESAGLSVPTMSSTYDQTFTYDQIIPGNLVKKTSTENSRNTPDPLNYDLDYTYDPNFVHRVERAGDKNFVYDLSGNLILEYDGEKQENPEEDDYVIINQENNVYGTEGAWGYGTNGNGGDVPVYSNKRRYEWDDRNQLIRTVDDFYDTYYVYNNEGQRVAKYTSNTTAMSETLYFNNFWTWHYDTANEYYEEGQYSKNIYLGETRIVTRLLTKDEKSNKDLEVKRTFYYHTDHLGSASLVTNPDGEIYERLEYTPYGEVWVDITKNNGTLYLPYKFSAKEKDSETGLYYYGARYLDPKYSLWKSADPALAEYIPIASTNDEWSKKNSNLPGMGGLFNPTNFHLYHYAGNNPIRYTDPNGEFSIGVGITFFGVTIQLKYGKNQGKHEFQWGIGVGVGYYAEIDLQDKRFTEDDSTKIGVYAEGSCSFELGEYGGSVSSKIGTEEVVNNDGATLQGVNECDVSLSYYGAEGGIGCDPENGIYIKEPEPVSSYGGGGMVSVGFGGSCSWGD